MTKMIIKAIEIDENMINNNKKWNCNQQREVKNNTQSENTREEWMKASNNYQIGWSKNVFESEIESTRYKIIETLSFGENEV